MVSLEYFQTALFDKTIRHPFWMLGIALRVSGSFVLSIILSSVM